jgi:glycosyltransferase involved in cell wall biosynthesis
VKICHVCNGHTADDGRVFHRACTALAQAGYEVHLLAQDDAAKPYERNGVVIHPLSACRTRLERFRRARAVGQWAAALQPDLFHVHEPDLLGPVLARAGSRPVIFDVHESYLDVLTVRQWLPGWLKPLARTAWDHWERRLVRRCAGIVVVTDRIAERYARLHGKVRVVANYPDCQTSEEIPDAGRDERLCVFVGSLTPARGLLEIVRALAILKRRGVAVRFAIAGEPVSEAYLQSLWEDAARLGVRDRIEYHGLMPRRDALALQTRASIGLVTYLPLNYKITGLPNKLMEYMALGLAVVASDFPEIREVAGATGAAVLVDPRQPEEIADGIERLVRDPSLARRMGRAGMRAVRERFNWNHECAKLLQLYRDILGAPAPLPVEAPLCPAPAHQTIG